MRVLTTGDEFEQLLDNAGDNLVFILFVASWCPPSNEILPKFEEYANEVTDTAIFAKADVDVVTETAQAVGICSMPTMYCYRNGEKQSEI